MQAVTPLAASDPAAVPPAPADVAPRQKLVAAQLLAAGEAPALAAAMAGIGRAELRTLEADPDFQELIRDCRAVEALPVAEQNARLERLLRRAAERLLADARVGAVGAGLRLLRHVTSPSEPAGEKRGWSEVARALADALMPEPARSASQAPAAAAGAPASARPYPTLVTGLADLDGEELDDILDEALERAHAAAAAKAGEPPLALLAWARSRDSGSGSAISGSARAEASAPDPEPAPGPARGQAVAAGPQQRPAAGPGTVAGSASTRPDSGTLASSVVPAAGHDRVPGPALAQAAPASAPHPTALGALAKTLGDDAADVPAGANRRPAPQPAAPAARRNAAPVRAEPSQRKKVKSRSKVPSPCVSTAAPYAREVAKVLTPPPFDAASAHPGATFDVSPALPESAAPAPAPEPGSIDDLATRVERLLAADFAVTEDEADLAEAVCMLRWPNWPGYAGKIHLGRLDRVLRGVDLDPIMVQRLGSAAFTAPLRDPWHPAHRASRPIHGPAGLRHPHVRGPAADPWSHPAQTDPTCAKSRSDRRPTREVLASEPAPPTSLQPDDPARQGTSKAAANRPGSRRAARTRSRSPP